MGQHLSRLPLLHGDLTQSRLYLMNHQLLLGRERQTLLLRHFFVCIYPLLHTHVARPFSSITCLCASIHSCTHTRQQTLTLHHLFVDIDPT